MHTLTFETKCYENDWKFVLQTSYLNNMIARCKVNFTSKQLIINNVNDIATVCRYADIKVKEGIIDKYYIANDYADEALSFFQISKNSFGKGYYYSIAELVGLYLCETDYHLHFSSDAYMQANPTSPWIEEAIQLMDTHPEYVVATPTWNRKFKEAKKQSHGEVDNFYISYGFSDQCYLMKTSIFKQPVYNEYNEASACYPKYGGELFEKRVNSYIRNHDLKRLVHKKVYYIHRNFPKNELLKKLRLYNIRKKFDK